MATQKKPLSVKELLNGKPKGAPKKPAKSKAAASTPPEDLGVKTVELSELQPRSPKGKAIAKAGQQQYLSDDLAPEFDPELEKLAALGAAAKEDQAEAKRRHDTIDAMIKPLMRELGIKVYKTQGGFTVYAEEKEVIKITADKKAKKEAKKAAKAKA